PNLVHFTTVLAASLIAITPMHSWRLLGLLVSSDGLFGIVYSALVWRNMIRHGFSALIDLEDRICYAALPAIGHAIMVAAGITLAMRLDTGYEVLALAMGVLLLVGIRNTWDMTIFIVIRSRE